jgi:hypothetical protein
MSPGNSGALLRFATAGMELCRLTAIGLLVAQAFPGSRFPALAVALSHLGALLLSFSLGTLSRRRIAGAVVHLMGFGVALVLTTMSLSRWPPEGAAGWFFLFSVAAILLAAWTRGAWFGTAPLSYETTVNRFDIGVGLLLGVSFLGMGLRVEGPLSLPLVGSYFLFGMLALSAARDLTVDLRFRRRRTSVWLLFSVVVAFLTLGGAVVLLFPIFGRAADQVQGTVVSLVSPLGPWVVAVLRFLLGFGGGRGKLAPVSGTPGETVMPLAEELVPSSGIVARILGWGMVLLFAVLALVLLGILLRKLLRYLGERITGTLPKGDFLQILRAFLLRLASFFRRFQRSNVGGSTRRPEAFRVLLTWGRRSGFSRRPSETAAEYARRISGLIPRAAAALESLVSLGEEAMYAERPIVGPHRRRLEGARRCLRSPRLYPSRLAARIGLRRASTAANTPRFGFPRRPG